MTNLPSNSFLRPVEPVQAFPYQQIDLKALGGLQPLIGDLIQTNAPKNKFLAETYSADPNAIQSRMSEYEAYDPVKLEGLAGYLSPLAAASHKSAQYFKKGTVNQALSGLTGLDSATSNEWSPLLSGLNSVGNFGGQSMYEIDKLKEHLNGLTDAYSPLDASEAQSLFQRAGKSLDPTGSLYGKQFYDKSKLGEVYDALPDAGTDIGGVKSLGGWLGAKYDPNFQDPRGMSPGGTYYADPWGYSHQVQRVSGTPYYFIPESNFEPTRSGTALTWYSPASSEGLYDYTYGGQRGLAFDPSKTNLSWTPGRNNDLYADKKGGGIGIDTIVSTALKFTPLAPVAYAYDAYNAIKNENWLGLGMAALGGLGQLSGFNPAKSIGSGISSGLGLDLSKAAQTALGGGLMGAGLGAIKDGTTGALMGGLSGGIGGYLGASGASPLTRIAAGTGLGALGSSLYGGDVGKGALSGLIDSTISTGLGELGRQMGQAGYGNAYKIGAGITSPLIRQMLANQLYKV